MCSPLQKKSLSLYLKSLEDQRNALHPMLDTISKAIDECNFWITEKDSSKRTFGEVIQQLEEINDSNLKTYSLLLGYFHLDVDAETYLDKSSTPTLVTTDQLQNLEQKCLQLEENCDTLNYNQKSFEKSCKKKSKYHERRTAEIEENIKALTERVEAQTELLTTHSDQIKQNTASANEIKKIISGDRIKMQEKSENVKLLLREQNDRKSSENELSETQLDLTSHFKRLELKYGILCQLLAKIYSIWDSEQVVINKLSSLRDEAYIKLNERISEIEEKKYTTPTGFSALVGQYNKKLKSGDVIKTFSELYFNIEGCFNPRTGEFTVPSDGVYCVSFAVYGVTNTDAAFELILQEIDDSPTEDTETEKSCASLTFTEVVHKDIDNYGENEEKDDDSDECSIDEDLVLHTLSILESQQHFVAVEKFKAGDKLFLKFKVTGECVEMPYHSSFTCYKIHDAVKECEVEKE